MLEKGGSRHGQAGFQGRRVCSERPIWTHCTAADIFYSQLASRHKPKGFGHPLDNFSIIILILIRFKK
jgi:hypothetical protein